MPYVIGISPVRTRGLFIELRKPAWMPIRDSRSDRVMTRRSRIIRYLVVDGYVERSWECQRTTKRVARRLYGSRM